MRLILDMVHHNPGEAPFTSAFTDPAHLRDYGFNGQVFKHLNTIATFPRAGVDCFPAGTPEAAWLESFTRDRVTEIDAAVAQGLAVYIHLDLFVLPRRLVEFYRDEICDPVTGRILLDRPRTLDLHRQLFEELTERFPQVAGYLIRVGETYLFDTPHHVGNGPIPRLGPSWTPTYGYDEVLAGSPAVDRFWTEAQVAAYQTLLTFLRQEVCERQGRHLIFRTWDIFPDRLHARLDHYRQVTDAIEPHERLWFSIKHTALDFWRHVRVNPCLGHGRHPQIIEVQCQREYEGKGAFPNYVMAGVIDGFTENADRRGLADLMGSPLVRGVFTWSRGGGWYGPYCTSELWPDLNAFVIAGWVRDPARGEAGWFQTYAQERLGLTLEDADRFRRLCLASAQAVLLGRHCATFDRHLHEAYLPTACWMRDDRLGGTTQLRPVLDHLVARGTWPEALAEKAEAVARWQVIVALADDITWPDPATGAFVRVSCRYGLALFRIVELGWRILITGARAEATGLCDRSALAADLAAYAHAWSTYRALGTEDLCPSLYRGEYFSLPGAAPEPGLHAAVQTIAATWCPESAHA